MLVESIICSPTPSYPYHIAAKRYFVHHERGPVEQRCDGYDKDLTLIFLHSTSFPKEIWEPTIEDLLHEHNLWGTRIREAYAIDCPNHGVAAVLNDGLLGDCAGMVKSLRANRANSHIDIIVLDHGVFSCSRDEIICRMRNAVLTQWSNA